MDIDHDGLQLVIDLRRCEDGMSRILPHLDAGAGYAAGIGRLGRSHDDAVLHQVGDSIVGRRHVGTLAQEPAAVGHHLFRILQVNLVLRRARDVQIGLDAPRLLASIERSAGELLRIRRADILAGAAKRQQVILLLPACNAVRIVDVAVRTGDGDDLRTELIQLAAGAPGHIAESGERHGLALQLLAAVLQHLPGKEDDTVAGRLRPTRQTAEGETFSCDHALVAIGEPLILPEQIADLPGPHAQVAGGHIRMRPDMAEQLRHEGLAETHHFRVGLAVGIEVRAALAAADGQTRQAVLEDLLESQELDDAGIDIRREPQAALVRPEGAVKFVAIAPVHLHFAVVIDPGHPEADAPLRLDEALDEAGLDVFRMGFQNRLDRGEDLLDRLQKFRFARVSLLCDLDVLFYKLSHGFRNLHSKNIHMHDDVGVGPARVGRSKPKLTIALSPPLVNKCIQCAWRFFWFFAIRLARPEGSEDRAVRRAGPACQGCLSRVRVSE